MKNDKIITNAELKIQPEFINEVLALATETRDKILLGKGTELFILTRKKDEPNTLVIFAKYTSKELYNWHLEQVHVKSFFAFLEDKLTTAPVIDYLQEI